MYIQPPVIVTISLFLFRQGKTQCYQTTLAHELYLVAEDMYLNVDVTSMIAAVLERLDQSLRKRLLMSIVLTGGNSRLNGLSLRLTRDLQDMYPDYAQLIKVLDPRLMTGRTDAVIGASYIRKCHDADWVTQQDYILYGAKHCVENARPLVYSV